MCSVRFLGLFPRPCWGTLRRSPRPPSHKGLLAFGNRRFAPLALAIFPPARTYFLVYPMQVLDHACVSDTLPLTSMRWRRHWHAQGLSPPKRKILVTSLTSVEPCAGRAAPPPPTICGRRRRRLLIGAPPPPIICRRAADTIVAG